MPGNLYNALIIGVAVIFHLTPETAIVVEKWYQVTEFGKAYLWSYLEYNLLRKVNSTIYSPISAISRKET